MEYFALYLLGSIWELRNSLITLWIVIPIAYWIYVIIRNIENYGEDFKFNKKILIAWLIMVIVGTILPTERSVQYMAAYYMGKEALQTDTVKKLTELLNKKLDEEIKDSINR